MRLLARKEIVDRSTGTHPLCIDEKRSTLLTVTLGWLVLFSINRFTVLLCHLFEAPKD